jgi:hypothetical protein
MNSQTKLNHAEAGATPPQNTKRVYRWADLPNATKPAKFKIEAEGQEPRIITVSRRKRQVLEGLMKSPILSASYCRISDQVLPLRRDYGVNITCTIYRGDEDTGREIYGVYTLENAVCRVDGGAL